MNIIINCGDYEISDRVQLGSFIKTKSYKLQQQIICERVNREITNFHLLHWRATKVVEKW